MIDTKLLKILTEVGLSENQGRVYLASLSLGPSQPTKIAEAAGIKRTTVYPVIESLQSLGIMNAIPKGFKPTYFVESPDKLEALIAHRHEQLKRSLGELAALFSFKTGEGTIRYYEGVNAIRPLYESMLADVEPKQDYLIISNPGDWHQADKQFTEDFTARRTLLDIKVRALLTNIPMSARYKSNEEKLNLRAKLLPKKFSFSANIVIIKKRIIIHQVQRPVWAAVIENAYIIKTFMEMFNLIWDLLPEEEP